ncbi:uncharacterized protein I303_107194 [Kwoniella dejecticola CBS 10117]|uniref:Uncharacterized protein n=1 Tax=Kwoniella dejecticola CBS 10117 TaxID=1296121 RepID=A0A1A5ZYZ6_9TREE|nr:uncharacterized protein I303_06595 [Kwoniella dejecticola CBS 10117]OBR83036.1 hypothetical protein I303_06595 [Kwoniella dejecticola CBS 10117]
MAEICTRANTSPVPSPVFAPPILPVYRPAIGPAPGPIIVQPAPIPPPLIPYPSGVSQTFIQPVQYPPQSYTSPLPPQARIPRYPSQQIHIGPQAEQTAYFPPRSGSRASQRRYSNEQPYNQEREYQQHHQQRPHHRRFSLDERQPSEYYSPKATSRRALTPDPQLSSHYRPRNHRSASTSQRIPEQHRSHPHHQEVFEEESGSSGEHRQPKYSRPSQRRSASTSAQHPGYLSVEEERIPNPPRRSFDHSSRDHLNPDRPVHAHTRQHLYQPQQERSSSKQGHQQQRLPVQSQNKNPGSRHTRTGSISSVRPSITGHGRTPSTDHLMVPERLDTLPQRKRKESLDTLRNQSISHQPAVASTRHPHTPTPVAANGSGLNLPAPHRRDSRSQQAHVLIKALEQPRAAEKEPARSASAQVKRKESKSNKTPKPIPKDLPTETEHERFERVRKLSSREILYPTPEAAQEAMRAERANNAPPVHRRPPTPYTQSRTSSSIVRKMDSSGSIRSRVSFDSTRSRGSSRSNRSYRSALEDSDSDDTLSGGRRWDPHATASTGIGPAGEAIEVIGLGRKKPQHRAIHSGTLRSALRSNTNLNSRTEFRNGTNGGREKPLPIRPMSYVAPIINSISRVTAPGSTRKIQKRSSHQSTPSARNHDMLGASSSVSNSTHNPTPVPLPRGSSRNDYNGNLDGLNGDGRGIRSLFSSLSLGPNGSSSTSQHDIQSTSSGRHMRSSVAPSRSSRRTLILPADDLLTYLRYVEIPSWDRWPLATSAKRGMGLWGGKRSLGLDELSWEWHRRLRLAEDARVHGRSLSSWEAQRGFERSILDWQDENVPRHPIDMANRWGTQIFALPAEGYDTLEFFEHETHQAEDLGLLSWVTSTILQTAVSTLHMLRYSATTFTFHLIPSPQPPHATSSHESPSYRQQHASSKSHYLWDGFGTMVLVNRSNDTDRAMILEIRPPSVVDSGVIKEFARGKNGEGWWGFYGETCVGDVGQANLLQAQVYDDCVQNQCYFFAITNLKYWVFGQFNSNYTRCTVSPVIHRQAKDPSLMQCLTAWVVRSVDERPRAGESLAAPPQDSDREHRRNRSASHTHSRGPEVSVHTEGSRARRSNSRSSFSLPPNPGYDQSLPSPSPAQYPSYAQPSSAMGMSPTGMYPNGTQTVYPTNDLYNTYGLPSYNDIAPPLPHPSSTMSPSPYSQPGMMFPHPHNQQQWNNSRAFSPAPNIPQVGTPMPYNFGNSWYSGGGVGGMFPWAGMR